MKRLKILPFLFLFPLLLTSCQKQLDDSNIVGKWKVTEFRTSGMDLNPIIIKGAKDIALSSVYEFKEDKSVVRYSSEEVGGTRGTFKVQDEGKRISITYDVNEYGSKEEYEVDSFNGSSMTWKQSYGELGYLLLTLKKE